MIPLSEQDVRLWDARLIGEAAQLMRHAAALGHSGPYQLMAAIHAAHASRRETGFVAWGDIATLYDYLISVRPSPVAEVNRAVALAEALGAQAGLDALAAIQGPARFAEWLPYPAARAGLCAKAGQGRREASTRPCAARWP